MEMQEGTQIAEYRSGIIERSRRSLLTEVNVHRDNPCEYIGALLQQL